MYNEMLNIVIFSRDKSVWDVLHNVHPLDRFEHNFLPVLTEFSISDVSDADVVIIDLPPSEIPCGIRSHCAAPDITIVLCEREETGGWAELSSRLDEADEIWPLPAASRLLEFYFSKLLKRIKLRKDKWLAETLMNTLIDSLPDYVWFKDARGAHINVNNSFCRLVGKTKEQCRNRGHYYIWNMTAEEYSKGEYVCLESEDVVMKVRKTCVFDENVKGCDGRMLQFRTYKSPVMDEDGSVIGTIGFAHDVTALNNIAAELDILLNSLVVAAAIIGTDDSVLNVNSSFAALFGTDADKMKGADYRAWRKSVLGLTRSLNVDEIYEKKYSAQDGADVELEIQEEPIFDVFHTMIGYFCFYRDVTEHKKHLELMVNYQNRLEADVRAKTQTILGMQRKILIGLADIVTSRDVVTGDHIKNTSKYVEILVNEMRNDPRYSELSDPAYCENVILAAPMHDIGKIAIPDAVLNKPGKYLPEEYEIMKKHSQLGCDILKKILSNISDPAYFKTACEMALDHHEKWNGTGYPNGIKNTEIPLSARIMAVADVFDALISQRPYKKPFTVDKAYDIISEGAGAHFDPDVVAAFIKARPEIERTIGQD